MCPFSCRVLLPQCYNDADLDLDGFTLCYRLPCTDRHCERLHVAGRQRCRSSADHDLHRAGKHSDLNTVLLAGDRRERLRSGSGRTEIIHAVSGPQERMSAVCSCSHLSAVGKPEMPYLSRTERLSRAPRAMPALVSTSRMQYTPSPRADTLLKIRPTYIFFSP